MKSTKAKASTRRAQPPLSPGETQALLRQAAEHRVAGRYDEAIGLYSEVEARNPEAIDAPYFLALIDLAAGRPVSARQKLEALARRVPKQAQVWGALSYVLRDLGLWSEALQALNRARALNPQRIDFDGQILLEAMGRTEEAIANYRAMAADPEARTSALVGLASLKPAALSARDKADLADAARREDLDPTAKAAIYFVLGEIAEYDKDDEAAFEAFEAGNRLRRQTLTGEAPAAEQPRIGPQTQIVHPDAAAERHRGAVAFRKTVFTPDFIAEHQGRGHHIAAPIFIVGMPRSGSTLLEQILSSHRRVQGLGETMALAQAVRGRYPLDLFAPNPPDHFRQMAELYLKAMHAQGWTSAPRFVDKNLYNYLEIGLIHLMLPKAVILHSVRDPVDTCLACWRQNFQAGQEFSYDLGEVGRQYVRYREMMDHWTTVLPGRVIDVSHEALVADPDGQIRRLVTEACGLAWDEACLRFYETKRPVRTASVAQVRQPIFTSSVQRWRRYEKHLGPLFEALGSYAPAEALR